MSDSPTLQDPLKLKRRRITAGLNQVDLAASAEVHRTYISYLERQNGKAKSATPRTLARIAKALGCEITDLLSDDYMAAGGLNGKAA